MISLEQHLAENAAEIRSQARQYAKSFGVSYEEAFRDVRDAFTEGYYESEEAARYGDWDYGRE